MKGLAVVVMMVLGLQAQAQLQMESGRYLYQITKRVEGSKTDLYNKAQHWVSDKFSDPKNTITSKEGKIIVSGSLYHELSGVPSYIRFTYTLEFLNGMYRESFENFNYKTGSAEVAYESNKLAAKKKIVLETDELLKTLTADLDTFMKAELLASKQE